jgi:hypothetical protein
MRRFVTFAVAGLMMDALPAGSQASIVVNIEETGGNVVASYNGSINQTGLTFVGGAILDTVLLYGTFGVLQFGLPPQERVLGYSISGPVSWGSGSSVGYPSSYTGDFFAIQASAPGGPRFYVNYFYKDDAVLNGTETFTGATLAGLGLNLGQYVYTAPGNQTITVNIGGSSIGAVPEPASWALMIAGLGLMGVALRRHAVHPRVVFT